MPFSLTLQAYLGDGWHDAAKLDLLEPERGHDSKCRLEYLDDYLDQHAEHLGGADEHALSVRFPPNFGVDACPSWPSFLLDIAPAGAAERFWKRRLYPQAAPPDLEAQLLRRAACNPIGHLRVKEATALLSQDSIQTFERDQILTRDSSFLDYAALRGAAIGGATGAGGDASKLLLAEDHGGRFAPDGALPDAQVARHWVVKFPRGEATHRDRLILRAEASYLLGARELGLEVVGPPTLETPPDAKPSLWLPRFDRQIDPHSGALVRVPTESFYSLAGISRMGAEYGHEKYLDAWLSLLKAQGQKHKVYDALLTYLKIDLLHFVTGNTDNHGHNLAITRLGGDLRLAPLYDLAPMVLDPQGITRSTRWPRHVEVATHARWRLICELARRWAKPARLWDDLRAWAVELQRLPQILLDHKLPQEVYEARSLHLHDLPDTLRYYGLL